MDHAREAAGDSGKIFAKEDLCLLNIVPGQSKRDAIAAYLGGRGIKFLANGLRPIFYLHYWLFPSQRFLLRSSINKQIGSASSKAKARAKPHSKAIPKIVWQTNYTNRVTLPIKASWLCNRLLSPGYDYKFHTTEMRKDFVEHHFPGETSRLYNRLTIGAAQADLWRLLVLYKYGGVYMDIDAHLVWPLNRIIPAESSALFLRYKDGAATNYFIASRPENPTIQVIISEVLDRIKHNKSNDVYTISGPAVFEYILGNIAHSWRFTKHTCLQGNFSNKFFQYIDKPAGHWINEQAHSLLIADTSNQKANHSK
ncbi:hypothetical protein KQ300_06860 [Synechococcus sp. CS-1331]|uniref:glycosyltransferase family 32 protein n=1 Tax=Synechococcus sp. CS-1331 TaxID=2847973 RepID=UPI0021AE9C86|nr:glycosyltransferase [Synechococcus sp. CS-1331]MCT0227907.1 hypothetical protein [Synechococcus sp. CS-1331]